MVKVLLKDLYNIKTTNILTFYLFIYLLRLYSTSAEGLYDTWSYSLFKVVKESTFEKVKKGEKSMTGPRHAKLRSQTDA